VEDLSEEELGHPLEGYLPLLDTSEGYFSRSLVCTA